MRKLDDWQPPDGYGQLLVWCLVGWAALVTAVAYLLSA